MTKYEQRLEQDLEEIRSEVERVGGWVTRNVRDAVLAITRFDRVRANETILRDRAVNKRLEELDHLCHIFIVKHLPSAGHLRFVSSVMRVSVALERVGDYAVTVCRESLRLENVLPDSLIQDLDVLGQQVLSALRSAIAAFVEGDLEKAAAGRAIAKQVNMTFRKSVADLIVYGDQDAPASDLFALMVASRVLKRVGDQAENIAEQTSFLVTGETKGPKQYRILFLDRDNSLLSIMAEAFGQEVFPEEGRFASAGVEPAQAFDAGFAEFLEGRGIDLKGTPLLLEDVLENAGRHFHIVVGIGVDPATEMDHVPFRTVVLQWDENEIRERAAGLEGRARYQALYRGVSERVTELMETLGLETDR